MYISMLHVETYRLPFLTDTYIYPPEVGSNSMS